MATVRGFPIRIKFITEQANFPEIVLDCHTLMDPYFELFERIKSCDRLCKILWVLFFMGEKF